jgi:branched-chain amino acid transport system permease protein
VNPELRYFLQQLLNGLAVGSMYALIAVGYSIVYSLLRLINFTHGDVYVFGTFIVYGLYKKGVPLPAAIVLGCLAGFAIGAMVERFVLRPVRLANRIVPIISALGTAMVLRTAAQLIWGPETLSFPTLGVKRAIMIGDLRIMSQQIQVLAIAAVCMAVFSLLFSRTKLGKATQCVMQDVELSRTVGIPVDTIIPIMYGLGGLLGVVGGVLFSSYYDAIGIHMGILGTIKAWAASMLGGVGSIYGAFAGGIILGVGEALAGAYLHQAYRDAFGYLLIIIVLLVKPEGLFGKKRVVKV